MSSLSCEKCDGASFLAVAFSIDGETGEGFLKREEEFTFDRVGFESITALQSDTAILKRKGDGTYCGSGIMCTAPIDGGDGSHIDSVYTRRWGIEKYDAACKKWNLTGIWTYGPDSGIEPCSVYLRHCFLAAEKLDQVTPGVLDSFLDETFLADRQTTIRQYISANPGVLQVLPPDSLIGRYSG
jgi:hypothetical protein